MIKESIDKILLVSYEINIFAWLLLLVPVLRCALLNFWTLLIDQFKFLSNLFCNILNRPAVTILDECKREYISTIPNSSNKIKSISLWFVCMLKIYAKKYRKYSEMLTLQVSSVRSDWPHSNSAFTLVSLPFTTISRSVICFLL